MVKFSALQSAKVSDAKALNVTIEISFPDGNGRMSKVYVSKKLH